MTTLPHRLAMASLAGLLLCVYVTGVTLRKIEQVLYACTMCCNYLFSEQATVAHYPKSYTIDKFQTPFRYLNTPSIAAFSSLES